ncbi:hypothetical protein O181_037180 [Austropuccinia psidii MF-1]|uniref:Uncharacterized protein n=1 Tax=Austropuccinia psidii MF-1 TaxID=1389203 RepID=A0A9Q3DAD8_9BASI|nr:hypothetical protein [Austropuccinia psidii MF-1]
MAIEPIGPNFGHGPPWNILPAMASGNHQRPPDQLSQPFPQLKGNSSHSSMHPVLKVVGVVHIWYYIPLCTILSQKFNGDVVGTDFHLSKSRSQNPMPILKEYSLTHHSGNPWQQSEDHSRIAITWPCRSWVGNFIQDYSKGILRGYTVFQSVVKASIYGAGVFDTLRELSEESIDPTEIWDINKIYNGFKSLRVIEPPCINCWKKGVPCVESANARSTRILWSSIKKGGIFGLEAPGYEPPTSDATCGHSNCNPIGVAPEVPILVTRKDGRLGKFKRNLVVQEENDTCTEGSDGFDGEKPEMTTPIQKRRIQSTSLSPFQASTTTNQVMTPPQPPQPPIRSPTRPSTLSSTSTNIQPPSASTSRYPMSPEPESIIENRCRWNITGNFTDQKKVNKKVVTSLFAEFDALTEVFVDKAIKRAIPGEPTIAFAKEAVVYEDALAVKFREAFKEF